MPTSRSQAVHRAGAVLAVALSASACATGAPASSPPDPAPDDGSSSGGTTQRCAGTTAKAEVQPLDLYLMLDRSLSMEERAGAVTKWGAISTALSSFVAEPLDGVSMGLQYFPSEDQYVPSGPGCAASRYARPEVEIGPLAQAGPQIRASMRGQQLRSGTPTAPALQGALDHGAAWASAHPGHAVVVLLATDGEPTTCNTELAGIEAIAARGLAGSPGIRTFVIGVGRSLANLDGIADAGGTSSAFLVDTGGDLGDQFLAALDEIRKRAVRCTYGIPPAPEGQTLDLGKVNVKVQPGSGATLKLAKVASAAECGTRTDAWYFDGASPPGGISLCPGTCAAVERDPAAEVELVLGCVTSHTGEW